MSDYELYGDYNEVDDEEEAPKEKRGLGFAIKLVAIIICFAVVAFLGFRLFTFNYYPRAMKNIYFTDTLTAYYNEQGGNIGALTQSLRAPYDDADLGNFFCDNLIVIPECGEIQLSLRFNTALYNRLGTEFAPEDVSFSLRRSGGDESATGAAAGVSVPAQLVYSEWDEFMMYKYVKLVFDGIDFPDGENKIEWLRLDITIDGLESDGPYMICIYENNDQFSKFTEYKLSRKERPK